MRLDLGNNESIFFGDKESMFRNKNKQYQKIWAQEASHKHLICWMFKLENNDGSYASVLTMSWLVNWKNKWNLTGSVDYRL